MPAWIIHWLAHASPTAAAIVFLLENLLIFGLVIGIGEWIVRRWSAQRVTESPDRITGHELALALINVALNTLVTYAGWQLWKQGWIHFRNDTGIGAAFDVVALMLLMDVTMYALHRLAHTSWLYTHIHAVHHRYDRVRPLTLFALHPLENLAFGALWLTVLMFYPASWLGMSIYLVLNVAFGLAGHLGVEPLPPMTVIAGSTFHANHHQSAQHNFGFYTQIWDRLWGTLAFRG